MHAEQRTQAGAFVIALLGLFGVRTERRRLFQLHAHVQAEQAQRTGHQERNAPAPVQHLRAAQRHVQRGDRARAGDVAAQRAELQPAAHQAAVAVGRILGDEGRRTPVLTTGGEALHDPGEQQQCRGPDADAVIGGNQADAEGAQRHQDHGEGQHFLAAVLVAEWPEHQPAQWTHQEGHGEGGEGSDQLRGRAAVGEEHVTQRDGEIAIDTEIKPLHRVAECGRTHGLLEHRAINDGDFVDVHLAAAFEPAEMGMCGMQVLHLLSPGSRPSRRPRSRARHRKHRL